MNSLIEPRLSDWNHDKYEQLESKHNKNKYITHYKQLSTECVSVWVCVGESVCVPALVCVFVR